VDDVYPYIDNLSGNRISGAFKFAFKEEYGASKINDSLLNLGVNPRNARDISLGFEMYRRTFLDSFVVGSLGGLARSSINVLATKGRNIFQNIGVIPGFIEESPSLFSNTQRSVLWSVDGLNASFGYGSKPWIASVGEGRGVVQEWATNTNKGASFDIGSVRKIGQIGSYDKLVSRAPIGGFQDRLQAHHYLLPQRTLKELGLSTSNAPAILLDYRLHRQTISYGNKKGYIFDTIRDEAAANIHDLRRLLRANGMYSPEIHRNIMQSVSEYNKILSKVMAE
jgi:hypothetical protein